MGRSFRSAFVLVVCFCVGICLGQKCDHMQTLLFLRVQKTGSSTMLRWLKAYKMGHQDSTLFSDVGGCKPVTLDPVDVLVDHPDLAECPASFSHDFSACQAKVNVHRQSSGHSQYWQVRIISPYFLGALYCIRIACTNTVVDRSYCVIYLLASYVRILCSSLHSVLSPGWMHKNRKYKHRDITFTLQANAQPASLSTFSSFIYLFPSSIHHAFTCLCVLFLSSHFFILV